MALSTVLSIAQQYTRLKGLEIPTALVASVNPGELQYMELLNKVGRDLRSRSNWNELMRYQTWTSVATEDQGAISTLLTENPDHIIQNTLWDNTLRQPITGPVSFKEYMSNKALVPGGPFYNFMVRGGHLFILNMPANHTLAVMYKTRNWCQTTASSGVYIDAIAADTNVSVFPDDLMLLGLEYLWRQEKGIDFSTQMAKYEMRVADFAGNNSVKPVLSMHNSEGSAVRPGIIIPAGNWTG